MSQTAATITTIGKDIIRCVLPCNHDSVLWIDREQRRYDAAVDNVQILHPAYFGIRSDYAGVTASAHLG